MAVPESRRRKLAALTRSIARGDIDAAQRLLRAGPGRKATAEHSRPEPAEPAAPIPLAEACPGVERRIPTACGEMPCWLIRRTLDEVAPDAANAAAEFARVMRGARQQFDELEASAALCHVSDHPPEGLLFMDTETCGFSGTPIFLVGVMFHEADTLVFEQWLARHYAEEPAILQAFWDRLDSAGVLVTFNGKAFDMNMIRERSAFHGLSPVDREPPHLDLLHECRRRYRRVLPNCRLQTLETHFCGRHRVGDIPGSAIPDAYHQYVASADARRVRDILHHNLLDMLTMAQLVTFLLTSEEPGGE